MRRSRTGYAAARLPEAEEKAFEKEETWMTIGTRVEAARGVVAAPVERGEIMQAGVALASARVVSRRAVLSCVIHMRDVRGYQPVRLSSVLTALRAHGERARRMYTRARTARLRRGPHPSSLPHSSHG